MPSPWFVIFIFAAIQLPVFTRSVTIFLKGKANRDEPRITSSTAWGTAVYQIALLGLLAACLSRGLLTLDGLGVRLDQPREILINGLAAWFLYWAASHVNQRFRATEFTPREYVRIQRLLWPRARAGQQGMILVLALNPVTEELISRGIMVRLVHQATDSLAAGLAAGFLVNSVHHLYQGFRAMPMHTLFFAVSTALAYSEAGLGAAILCHLIADLSVAVRSRAHLAWARTERVKGRKLEPGAVKG